MLKLGASDMHLEPDFFGLRIRYRIDGVMTDILELPGEHSTALVHILKGMAGINPELRERPGEGKISLLVKGSTHRYLVSSMPVIKGERLTIHSVMDHFIERTLTELGFSAGVDHFVTSFLGEERGLFVITGSLGDGRSTTALSLARRQAHIQPSCTAVELSPTYEVPEVRQIKCGSLMEFLRALSELALSPAELVVIDEVTSPPAMQCAARLTESSRKVIVLTRSRNAFTALRDLVDMGITRDYIASSLRGVLAQKLVKTICPHCRAPYNPHPWELRLFESQREFPPGSFSRGEGCEQCRHTGYLGRTPLEHLVIPSGKAGLSEALLAEREVKEGLYCKEKVSLLSSAGDKCLRGVTTLQEIARVLEL
ncbi:MAG: ATPase, T2SS/T4P/T4SS family [Candidatus Eremiobacteraeota bacterium]|nr:ATPase, T2SS/T4P/T4SS family [Candidatus Eremiobacteraeota bacterium]